MLNVGLIFGLAERALRAWAGCGDLTMRNFASKYVLCGGAGGRGGGCGVVKTFVWIGAGQRLVLEEGALVSPPTSHSLEKGQKAPELCSLAHVQHVPSSHRPSHAVFQ